MDDEPQTLKSVFAAAESRREALEGAYEASFPSYQDALVAAIMGYEECLKIISSLSLFSPNETADDIATTDLPYLLVDYHLAELIQKVPTTTPAERKVTLKRARHVYESYLHQLDNYSLLGDHYSALLETYTEDPRAFSTVPTTDPNARRNSKIANFKTEKDLKSKLDFLRRRPSYLDRDGADEDAVRDVHLAHLAFSTHMAFQALESLNREEEMLAQAPVPLIPQTTTVEEDEERRQSELKADGYSERLDRPLRRLHSAFANGGAGSGPLLSKDGKPVQPFTIVGSRAEIAKGVFKAGHSLPTMSIDEYLAEERRRGGIIEGGGEASGRRPEPDEDDMERADAETMKAREWDEFTEANPRGAGNTLNRG